MSSPFHFVTVGTSARMVRNLWDRIGVRGGYRVSHIVHPTYDRSSWEAQVSSNAIHFFREDMRAPLPAADRDLLASLEGGDVPTVHNMIMSDRVVRRLDHEEALAYATLLARRLFELYERIDPSVVIGDFDALHSAIGLAVARRMDIPWFALNFSTIPKGQVALCTNLSPTSAVMLEPQRREQMRTHAEEALRDFESRKTRAHAYVPPQLLSPSFVIRQAPAQLKSLVQVLRRRRLREYRKYSDYRNSYSMAAMFHEALRLRKNQLLMRGRRFVLEPPAGRYAFFGLHMQPESSIDVFAHFFSNQLRIIELMSRSLPPTHTLLVKLHKSDVPNYSPRYLKQLAAYPGVQLVSPYADAYQFIRGADIVFAIQGTIGLEAALLGKPVIMFGDSPTRVFPSVSTFGKTIDLPQLVRAKLAEAAPPRTQLIDAFARYLAPFYPAAANDWSVSPTDAQIQDYVRFFELMKSHVDSGRAGAARRASVKNDPSPAEIHS